MLYAQVKHGILEIILAGSLIKAGVGAETGGKEGAGRTTDLWIVLARVGLHDPFHFLSQHMLSSKFGNRHLSEIRMLVNSNLGDISKLKTQ